MSGRIEAIALKQPTLTCQLLLGVICVLSGGLANAAVCTVVNTKTADVAALDQPVLFNRLGASNINGMVYSLTRDLVAVNTQGTAVQDQPINLGFGGDPTDFVGNVALRPDKRPRPLVLRIAAGDCLQVNFWNLLTILPNPANVFPPQFNVFIDEQVAERHAGFHAAGMQLVNSDGDDGTYVGENTTNGMVEPGGFAQYTLYAEHEGTFVVRDLASTTGSDGNQGNSGNLLFGQIIVEPKGARIYRGQLTEEELRLASMVTDPAALDCGTRNLTAQGQPRINYEATYPAANCTNGTDLGALTWALEGKSGLPILNMTCNAAAATAGACAANEIVHSEINALVAGPDADGSWHSKCPGADCPYPLERIGKRNPTLPNRLEPFRDFASIFHDEPATAQAFRGFYVEDPVFRYVLAGVKDGFMINYGSGGIGSEIMKPSLTPAST
ncbi:MAG: hypothetical protein P8Y76_14745 [bacterium]